MERSNIHWVVPRSPNTLFTGRKDILDDLERRVRAAVQDGSPSNQCRVVITGLGGQGKSEISLQLAQRVRSL
jgi:Cdc6-like AAA superfamily ATPase